MAEPIIPKPIKPTAGFLSVVILVLEILLTGTRTAGVFLDVAICLPID